MPQTLCACLPNAVVADPHDTNALPRLLCGLLDGEGGDHFGGHDIADGVECHPIHMAFDGDAAGLDGSPEALGLQLDPHQQGPVVVVSLGEHEVVHRPAPSFLYHMVYNQPAVVPGTTIGAPVETGGWRRGRSSSRHEDALEYTIACPTPVTGFDTTCWVCQPIACDGEDVLPLPITNQGLTKWMRTR